MQLYRHIKCCSALLRTFSSLPVLALCGECVIASGNDSCCCFGVHGSRVQPCDEWCKRHQVVSIVSMFTHTHVLRTSILSAFYKTRKKKHSQKFEQHNKKTKQNKASTIDLLARMDEMFTPNRNEWKISHFQEGPEKGQKQSHCNMRSRTA